MARIILAISATSASSKQILSTAAPNINTKRSPLYAPSTVDKVAFANENARLDTKRSELYYEGV